MRGHAGPDYQWNRAWNFIASKIEVGEARACVRRFDICGVALVREPIQAGFDAITLAWTARLRVAGIAHEQQFGIEFQRPERQCSLQPITEVHAGAKFSAF